MCSDTEADLETRDQADLEAARELERWHAFECYEHRAVPTGVVFDVRTGEGIDLAQAVCPVPGCGTLCELRGAWAADHDGYDPRKRLLMQQTALLEEDLEALKWRQFASAALTGLLAANGRIKEAASIRIIETAGSIADLMVAEEAKRAPK